jgi:hypothetical protein
VYASAARSGKHPNKNIPVRIFNGVGIFVFCDLGPAKKMRSPNEDF